MWSLERERWRTDRGENLRHYQTSEEKLKYRSMDLLLMTTNQIISKAGSTCVYFAQTNMRPLLNTLTDFVNVILIYICVCVYLHTCTHTHTHKYIYILAMLPCLDCLRNMSVSATPKPSLLKKHLLTLVTAQKMC